MVNLIFLEWKQKYVKNVEENYHLISLKLVEINAKIAVGSIEGRDEKNTLKFIELRLLDIKKNRENG